MLFRDLLACNKDWEETTELIVVSKDSPDAVPIRRFSARFVYGDRQVLWFRDRVVMLL